MRVWILAGLVVVGVVIWLWRSAQVPAAVHRVEAPPASTPAPRTPTRPLAPNRSRIASLPQPQPFDPATRHTADPCTALLEPRVPTGFEEITEGPITVAWDPAKLVGPNDAPLRPVALAHAVVGVLEEAAQLTGTDRRAQLTVIIDASTDALQTRTRLPTWVGGMYDGAAVHVPANMTADLGVTMRTLRHEIMHAQIHAAVGCVPFWFNEGLANYFAGRVPTREWLAMMRAGEAFDLASLRDPAILDLADRKVARMYAVSLAMVAHIVHRRGETGLREAVRTAQSTDKPLELWELVEPGVDYRMLVDELRKRVLGADSDNIEALLEGNMCCRHLRQPAQLACRAAPPDPPPPRHEICRRW